MTIQLLLQELRARDIWVWADGNRLRCSTPAGVPESEVSNLLQQRKNEILEFLRGPAQLSFAQQRLWFLDQIAPEGAAYIIAGALELRGVLDAPVLERALGALVQRHEALRTVFVDVEGEPRQVVAEPGVWTLPVTDLSREVNARERLKQLLREEAARGFELARGPLFRAQLYRLAPDAHVLMLAMHHIVSDGWSLEVLRRELGELYGGYSRGERTTLPALRVQYRDFARWQRGWLQGEVLERLLAHWRSRLEGGPQVLELPTDRPRPPRASYRGARYSFTLPRELVERLHGLSRCEGATLFMTLLSAFALLLSRYSGQRDLLIGTPIANRNRAEIEALVGSFVNTLVMRADLSGEPSVREFLGRMREVCLDAYAHQDLPFERLVEELRPARDLSRNPLFQVMFALQNAPQQPLELPGLTLSPVALHAGVAHFDLSLLTWETADGLACRFSYATDLFEESTVARLGADWRAVLEAMVATPERSVWELPLLTEVERHQLLVERNDTETDHPADALFHRLFEAQAARTPGAVAVASSGRTSSYGELDRHANQLAHSLRECGEAGKGAMAHVIDTYELSPLQWGMLFHVLSGGDPGVNVQQVLATLREPLDEAHFLRAWQRVLERHPILRSRLRWEGVAQPMQDVIDQVKIPVERFDWRALTEAERQQRFQVLLDHDRARGFDLGEAPLLRLALVRAGEREHWVLWTYHHALLDGRSRLLVLREVFSFYEAFSGGADADFPLPRPYRDYIEWLRKVDYDSAKAYWQGALSGFRAPTPLVVARDREAGRVTGTDRRSHEIRLSAALTTALKERAREASVTLNNVVQGAWALLLHRYSGEPDIVFGATRACRKSALGGADDMIGLFINTLPMRVRVDPEAELAPWLRQLRDQQVALRDYEHTPLVMVQGWSEVPRGTPLFESILMFENQTLDARLRALGGAWGERCFHYRGLTNYPLMVIAFGDHELLLQLEYSRRRFDDDVVARMLGHLRMLLEGMAAHPQVRLKDLPLLTAAERHQLLVEWNDTDIDYPADALLHKLFEAQAARTPDAVAVVSDGRTLSYGELDRRANQLAHALRKRGVGPDVLVGLCLNRTPDMVVALLGVLKAGGAYVPIDPEYPAERIAFMLKDCAAKVLITEESCRASLPPLLAVSEVIYLDRDAKTLAAERQDEPQSEVDPSHLAYAIYTSGSTGQPKAALLTHRGLFNLAVSEIRLYGIAPQSRVLQFASLSFDAAISEIAMALCSGATLYVEGRETLAPGPELERYLEREKITVLLLTPSALAMLDPIAVPSVEQLIVGGEPCSAELAARWAGRCRFFNTYGPTETTVTTTCVEYRDGAMPPLIGRPLPNVRVYLLDQALEPVPVGVTGELYIGGIGVARGYLGRPKLSAERFLPDPFRNRSGGTMYRTGDFGRWRADGQIEFIGRTDDQVKIRGFRVELGEIEAALQQHPAVREVAVIAREDAPVDKRLVAYVAAANPPADLVDQLRVLLRVSLPEYMVPAHFVTLEALPLTPNGKVDRRALPAPDASRPDLSGSFVAPRNPLEQVLAGIWADVLRLEQVGVRDNFFDLGGHSLLAIKVISRLRDALQVDLPLRALLEAPTVAGLAAAALQDSERRAKIERRAQLLLTVSQLSDDQVAVMSRQKKLKEGNRA